MYRLAIITFTLLILIIWTFMPTFMPTFAPTFTSKKASSKRVKWRDECTSKELASVIIIPNRDSKYEDLPEYTSSRYLPDVEKLANKPENKINELTMLIEPPPKELLEYKPRLML